MFGKRRRQKDSASQNPSQVLPQALAPLADMTAHNAVARGPMGIAPTASSTQPAVIPSAALAMLVRQQSIESTGLDRKAQMLAKLQAQPAGRSNTLPAVLRPVLEENAAPPTNYPAGAPPTGLSHIPPWHQLPV